MHIAGIGQDQPEGFRFWSRDVLFICSPLLFSSLFLYIVFCIFLFPSIRLSSFFVVGINAVLAGGIVLSCRRRQPHNSLLRIVNVRLLPALILGIYYCFHFIQSPARNCLQIFKPNINSSLCYCHCLISKKTGDSTHPSDSTLVNASERVNKYRAR